LHAAPDITTVTNVIATREIRFFGVVIQGSNLVAPVMNGFKAAYVVACNGVDIEHGELHSTA